MMDGLVLSHQPAELGDAEPRLQSAVDGRAQQGGPVGDDAVQFPGRHHEVFALLRHHQGGDARRDHWQAQTGRVQMLAAAGLKKEWIYKKTQVLAIFDDLDTILLMIPDAGVPMSRGCPRR